MASPRFGFQKTHPKAHTLNPSALLLPERDFQASRLPSSCILDLNKEAKRLPKPTGPHRDVGVTTCVRASCWDTGSPARNPRERSPEILSAGLKQSALETLESFPQGTAGWPPSLFILLICSNSLNSKVSSIWVHVLYTEISQLQLFYSGVYKTYSVPSMGFVRQVRECFRLDKLTAHWADNQEEGGASASDFKLSGCQELARS